METGQRVLAGPGQLAAQQFAAGKSSDNQHTDGHPMCLTTATIACRMVWSANWRRRDFDLDTDEPDRFTWLGALIPSQQCGSAKLVIPARHLSRHVVITAPPVFRKRAVADPGRMPLIYLSEPEVTNQETTPSGHGRRSRTQPYRTVT